MKATIALVLATTALAFGTQAAAQVTFYEQDGSPPGLDAAIYQPNTEWEWELDLKFTKPAAAPLVEQTFKAKAKSNGDDIITQVVVQAAQAIFEKLGNWAPAH